MEVNSKDPTQPPARPAINPGLARRARVRAAIEGTTFSAIVERALEEHLDRVEEERSA